MRDIIISGGRHWPLDTVKMTKDMIRSINLLWYNNELPSLDCWKRFLQHYNKYREAKPARFSFMQGMDGGVVSKRKKKSFICFKIKPSVKTSENTNEGDTMLLFLLLSTLSEWINTLILSVLAIGDLGSMLASSSQ